MSNEFRYSPHPRIPVSPIEKAWSCSFETTPYRRSKPGIIGEMCSSMAQLEARGLYHTYFVILCSWGHLFESSCCYTPFIRFACLKQRIPISRLRIPVSPIIDKAWSMLVRIHSLWKSRIIDGICSSVAQLEALRVHLMEALGWVTLRSLVRIELLLYSIITFFFFCSTSHFCRTSCAWNFHSYFCGVYDIKWVFEFWCRFGEPDNRGSLIFLVHCRSSWTNK